MSAENAETTETGNDDDTTDDRFESELVAILGGLDESAEPWKLRPPESADDPAKLLVGARPGLVRGRLEGAGYEVRDLELPVERDGWVGAWEVSS
jgi:hypothetical protein